jgi:hypothetical protein
MPTSVGLVALVTMLTLLDTRRRHETVLLANLGVGASGLLVVSAAPPVLLELSAWLALP